MRDASKYVREKEFLYKTGCPKQQGSPCMYHHPWSKKKCQLLDPFQRKVQFVTHFYISVVISCQISYNGVLSSNRACVRQLKAPFICKRHGSNSHIHMNMYGVAHDLAPIIVVLSYPTGCCVAILLSFIHYSFFFNKCKKRESSHSTRKPHDDDDDASKP